jgi:4-hydroxymandelate oxidase
MGSNNHQDEQRRQLLTWLAASPLFALAGNQSVMADEARELTRKFTKRPDPNDLGTKHPIRPDC